MRRQRNVIEGYLRQGSQQHFVAVVLDPFARSGVQRLNCGIEQRPHRPLRRSTGERLERGRKKSLSRWLDDHGRRT